METFLIILLGIIVATIVAIIGVWYQRKADATIMKKALDHMDVRHMYSSEEFGIAFYPDQAKIASEIRNILSNHIPIDISQLEPVDRAADDLRMSDLDSMADVAFFMELEEKFKIKIPDADAQKMQTFDDICKYIIAKLKEKEQYSSHPVTNF